MNIATVFTRGAALFALLVAPLILHAQPSTWMPRGPGGGGALFQPSFSPSNASELYIACDMTQLFHTTDLGESWGQVDFRQLQVSGTVGRVQFTSDPNVMYTISQSGDAPHPVRSNDGGATWQNLPSDPTGGGAFSLWTDPSSTQRLILTSYSDLYFSTDGGASFAKKYTTASSQGLHVGGAFFDGVKIYVGTNVGLVRSNDNGGTFSVAATPGIPATQSIVSLTGAKQGAITRLLAVTLVNTDVYAGITGADYSSYKGIYSLDAGGGGWVSRSAGIPAGNFPFFVAMASNNVSTAYVAGGSSGSAPIVYKTTDVGATWTSVLRTTNNDNVKTGWSGYHGDREWSYGEYALGLAVSPTDPDKAVITDLGFAHLTANGGTDWKQVYTLTADQNAAGSPTQPARSYHSIGLENTTCWQVAWADSLHMIGCYSDIKGTVSTDAGTTWGFNYAGQSLNSMYRVVAGANGTLYAATASVHDMYQSTTLTDARIDGGTGQVLYSGDNGHSWQTLHAFGHNVVWVATDPSNPNRLYAAVAHSTLGGIYVSNDIQNGASSAWTKLATPPRTEGHPFNIVVLKDGTLLCTYSGRRTATAFTNSSGVFVSPDGGATWVDRSSPQMLYWTKDVVVDSHDASQNTWYVGVFSGWGGAPNGLGGLYRTTDRGLTWGKILDVDRVTSCTVSPTNPNEMYATSEVNGLWYSSNVATDAPTFSNLASYPFRQPERVFYNPYKTDEVWVTSFGNGMKYGSFVAQVNPPLAPTLISPANDSAGVPVSRSLRWNSVSGATTYQVQLSTRADFTTVVLDSSNLPSPSSPFTGLATSTKYYWRARGANSAGGGIWSPVWSFTTVSPGAPTTAPTLISPANDSTNTPRDLNVQWSGIGGISTYQMQLSTDSTFTTKTLDTTISAKTVMTVSGLAEHTKYYWRVRGANGAGSGPWSPVWNFTTSSAPKAPAAPTLQLPTDGATGQSVTATVAWDSTPGATSYHLQLSMRSDFSIVQIDTTGLIGLSYLTQKLATGTTYYWRVSAINGVGQGAWSPTWSFTTTSATGVAYDPASPAARLLRSYPNPASGHAVIELELPHAGYASVTIVNSLGQNVATVASRVIEAGRTAFELNTAGLPSGDYYCRLSYDGMVRVERMQIVR